MGIRRIRVTVCNVPATVTGEVLAAFLSRYRRVEESNLLRSASRMAYGDHVFQLSLTREGFQAIPEIIISRERQMMLVVEGQRPCCWSCKQLGHISKFCSQKDPPSAAASTATTATTTATITTATISSTTAKESGQVQPKNMEEGWTEVTRKKRSPKKVEDKASTMTITATASPAKGTDSERSPQQSPPKSPPKAPQYIPKSVTAPISWNIVEHPVLPANKSSAKKSKSKENPTTTETSGTPMETFTNLKRWRNSNEGAAKKICAGPPCIDDPLEGPLMPFSLPLNRHQYRCQSHSLLFHFFLLHFLHHLPLNTEFHNMLPLNSYKIYNPYNLRNPFNFLNLLNLHNPYMWNLKPALIKSNPFLGETIVPTSL